VKPLQSLQSCNLPINPMKKGVNKAHCFAIFRRLQGCKSVGGLQPSTTRKRRRSRLERGALERADMTPCGRCQNCRNGAPGICLSPDSAPAARRCGCGAGIAGKRRFCPTCAAGRHREAKRRWWARTGKVARQIGRDSGRAVPERQEDRPRAPGAALGAAGPDFTAFRGAMPMAKREARSA